MKDKFNEEIQCIASIVVFHPLLRSWQMSLTFNKHLTLSKSASKSKNISLIFEVELK